MVKMQTAKTEEATIRLSKHHGTGNDFLVLIDPSGTRPLLGPEVRALCDRRRGIGADGFLRGLMSDDGRLVMELHNADGSRAEMSGNGIRCLVQAAVLAGLVAEGEIDVVTDAGVRQVEYCSTGEGGHGEATVTMGPARLGSPVEEGSLVSATAPLSSVHAARLVDMGNPHLVVNCELPDDDLLQITGPLIESRFDGGINVEFVALDAAGRALEMKIWERGVGVTMACGTGACAAAAAARSWGLVADDVVVISPGGELHVHLGDGEVLLSGATQWCGYIEIPRRVLDAMAQEASQQLPPFGRTTRTEMEVVSNL